MAAICSDECEMLARYTEAYVAAVKTQLLAALGSLDPSVHERMQDVYKAVITATGRHDNVPDFDLALSAASDIKQDAIDDLLFVHEQVLNLAIAGLYHFWERSMRRVLLRAHRFRLPVPSRGKIEKANMQQLLAALHATGNRQPSPELLEEFCELSLLANVVKHGAGTSLRDLAARFPERVEGEAPDRVIPESVQIFDSDLDRFGNVVATFWRSIH